MTNRFENCKTLVDLYNVFATMDVVDYTAVNDAEKDRLVVVFAANVPEDMVPETPLTEAGYNHIWNVTVDNVDTKEDATMDFATMMDEAGKEAVNNLNGGNVMETKWSKLTNAVKGLGAKAKSSYDNTKVHAGQDFEDFKGTCDEEITGIVNTMGPVLTVLDDFFGCTRLIESVNTIMYKDLETKSRRGFFNAAAQARKVVQNEIEFLEDISPDAKADQILALKYVIGTVDFELDELGNPVTDNGKPIVIGKSGRRSIFEVAINAIVWISKKVARKIKKWFGVDASTNIFGSVGASIASVFGMAAGVIKGVIKIVAEAVIFVGSYVFSAIINAVGFVWNQIKKLPAVVKSLGGKIKSFASKDEEEDVFEDEELEAELAEEEEALFN